MAWPASQGQLLKGLGLCHAWAGRGSRQSASASMGSRLPASTLQTTQLAVHLPRGSGLLAVLEMALLLEQLLCVTLSVGDA